MEYFNVTSNEYFTCLHQRQSKNYKFKLELLSEYEQVIGEIERDFSKTAKGQINVNYQQLSRRSCSITVINTDKKYLPSEDSFFWIDRKFKLWVGIVVREDVYWFSQGIFITKGASCDSHTLKIEAVDKGGFLDGTLKTNSLATQVLIEKGSNVANLFRDTLSLSNGYAIVDPKSPIIEKSFKQAITAADISINRDEFIGDLFKNVADSYSADIYYDTEGRFNVSTLTEGNRADGYNIMPSEFDFEDSEATFINSSADYQYDCINAITVYTDIKNTEDENDNPIENISYTAYNNSPLSPLRVSAIRIRAEVQEIKYVDVSPEKMEQLCKEYAQYLLFKKSMLALSVDFNAQIIPHLDVDRVITITDKIKGLENERFIIQSLSIPLSAGEMSIKAVKIQDLPVYMDIEKGI